jgi:glycine/serine hydroxymethyltransferase
MANVETGRITRPVRWRQSAAADIAGATAYPRIIDFPAMWIADEAGVRAVDMAHRGSGGGAHPRRFLRDGTTTAQIPGTEGAMLLCKSQVQGVDKAARGRRSYNHTTPASLSR